MTFNRSFMYSPDPETNGQPAPDEDHKPPIGPDGRPLEPPPHGDHKPPMGPDGRPLDPPKDGPRPPMKPGDKPENPTDEKAPEQPEATGTTEAKEL